MTDPSTNPFRNPVGQVFALIVEQPDFAEKVRTDPDDALAPYDLAAEDREALVADAHALDSDVEGFAQMQGGSPAFLQMLGGLRTPQRLGFDRQVYSYTGCLTCI